MPSFLLFPRFIAFLVEIEEEGYFVDVDEMKLLIEGHDTISYDHH